MELKVESILAKLLDLRNKTLVSPFNRRKNRRGCHLQVQGLVYKVCKIRFLSKIYVTNRSYVDSVTSSLKYLRQFSSQLWQDVKFYIYILLILFIIHIICLGKPWFIVRFQLFVECACKQQPYSFFLVRSQLDNHKASKWSR